MESQISNESGNQQGVLYLVPTPIGNLEDMTYRAIRILKEADLIAAEDTRNTKKLCNYFEISTPLISYHEHNKETSGKGIIERLDAGGTIALVSDAGMPCISDPGYELVKVALQHHIRVIPLPGANAAVTALIASGIKPQPFYFYGFLPRGKKGKTEELEKLKHQKGAVIFYESPHRLKETLKGLNQVFGNRNISLCRELTKKFEEFLRGSMNEAVQWAEKNEIKGEFVLIVEGNEDGGTLLESEKWWAALGIKEHIVKYIEDGMSSKDAIKQVAKDRNIAKRDVYHSYHIKD